MPDTGEIFLFSKRLHHHTPSWVPSGSCFHIRLRVAPPCLVQLTKPCVGHALLNAAHYYHQSRHWSCRLILLMPDHLHALLQFPDKADMSRILGDWKRFTALTQGVIWQTNYFDHRIRDHHSLHEAAAYIRRNPVAKGLCAHESDWPWVWPALAHE